MSERTRTTWAGLFGVSLGIIELVLGAFIVSFAVSFSLIIENAFLTAGAPSTTLNFFNALTGIAGFGGIYVLVHAVKRSVDNGFSAYIASKQRSSMPHMIPPPALGSPVTTTMQAATASMQPRTGQTIGNEAQTASGMQTCGICHGANSVDSKFCRYCGARFV